METKSLNTILELESNNVIIPEIQREYVWGMNENVLKKFLNDIGENVNNKEMNVGFLYSYKPYTDSNVIYLIDGQQRFTTLILLAFCCAIKEIKEKKIEKFRKLLKFDNPTPAFSYRVRISTEKFLTDLFKNTEKFEKSDIKEEIEDKKWYLESYKKDASIKAILNALKIIQDFLKKNNDINFEYITNSVLFWYFNVGVTSQGEELYITMNSRGESLTSSEQIKPLLFEKLENAELKSYYGKKWDDWEEHFYSMINTIPEFSINKVNLMMDRFIQTILQIEKQTSKNDFKANEIEEINLHTIEKYFIALERLESEIKKWESGSELLACLYDDSQKNEYLYPFTFLLKSIYVYQEIKPEEIKRIYQVIRNAVRRKNGNGVVNYVPMLNLLKEYKGDDFYDFILSSGEEKLKNVLDEHEFEKIDLIKSSGNIESVEALFWQAQQHTIFKGNIKPLISWAVTDGKLDIGLFERYFELFNELFSENLLKKDQLDITRRALLTRELNEYPKRFKGSSNYSFCWDPSDWKTLISENVIKFGSFLKELLNEKNIIIAQQKMIDDKKDKDNDGFLNYPELLEYCKRKNIQDRKHLGFGWLLIKGTNARTCAYLNAYRLYIVLKNEQWQDWKIEFVDRVDMRLSFDFAKNKSVINIYYKGYDKFNLHLFRKDKETCGFFLKFSSLFDLSFKEGHYESQPMSREEIEKLFRSIKIEVEKL